MARRNMDTPMACALLPMESTGEPLFEPLLS
jgi:hypothetical protein